MYTNNFESSEISLGTYVSQVMRRVYVKMFLALIVTAVTAWFVSSSPALLTILFSNTWSVFALMGIDKSKAKRHLWRIPEKTLFLSALLGGGAGAIIGMYFFHHKTRHWYFVIGMPMILIAEVAIYLYFIR